VAAFRQGLQEAGFVGGQNVAIESRFAEGTLIACRRWPLSWSTGRCTCSSPQGAPSRLSKAKPVVPATVPSVFAMGGDPVKLGVVVSLARPGGNITEVSFLVNELAAKSVELLHKLVPTAAVSGFLVNPNDPNAESDTRGAQRAADALGLHLGVAKASTASEIDSAFTTFVQQQVAALFVDTEPFFTDQCATLVALAARHALPAVYQVREFAATGGLLTYGHQHYRRKSSPGRLHRPSAQGHRTCRSAGRPYRDVYSSCCQRTAVTRRTLDLGYGMVSSGAYVDTKESGHYEPVIFSCHVERRSHTPAPSLRPMPCTFLPIRNQYKTN